MDILVSDATLFIFNANLPNVQGKLTFMPPRLQQKWRSEGDGKSLDMLECYPMKGNRGMENLSDSIDYLNYHWLRKATRKRL